MVIILVPKGCETFSHEYHLERSPVGFELSAVAMEITFFNLSDNHSRMSLFEISQRPFLQCYSIGALCTLLAGSICIPVDAYLPESASTWRRIMWISLLIVDNSAREFSPGFKILIALTCCSRP